MYTEADKVFFVQRMWAEGLTPTAAAKKWGRPYRASLAAWLRQAESGELDVPRPPGAFRCDHAKHGRYPEETRAEALRRYALGEKPAHIARALGLPGGGVVTGWARGGRARATIPRTAEPQGPAGTGEGAAVGTCRRASTVSGRDPSEMGADELRAELAAALERLAVLEEVVRDPKAGGPASLSSRQKAELGERLRRACGISLRDVLSLLGISKSTYEYNRARLDAPGRGDSDIEAAVAEVFSGEGRGARGYRFVHARLAARGVRCSEKRVRRAMRSLGLVPRRGRSRRWSSYAGEVDDAPANLTLGERGRHDFSAPEPNRLWVTDISEFGIPAGKLYLSPVLDCFDGAPVAWGVSEHPDGALADGMLRDAISTLPGGRAPEAGLALHSDRGVHYRRGAWYRACEDAGIARSMSRKGHSPDNSRMEGFFGTMKVEMFYGRDWSRATLGDLRAEIEDYMSRFSSERIKYFKKEGYRTATEADTINGRRERLGVPAAPAW